jgi:hypothetical protein
VGPATATRRAVLAEQAVEPARGYPAPRAPGGRRAAAAPVRYKGARPRRPEGRHRVQEARPVREVEEGMEPALPRARAEGAAARSLAPAGAEGRCWLCFHFSRS